MYQRLENGLNKYEIKIWFSKTHRARSTVFAKNQEEARMIAYKKYKDKTISQLIFL